MTTKTVAYLPQSPIAVYPHGNGVMLAEDHGRRRVVLTGDRNGNLMTCGADGRLVLCDGPDDTARVLHAIAARYNAYDKMLAACLTVLNANPAPAIRDQVYAAVKDCGFDMSAHATASEAL